MGLKIGKKGSEMQENLPQVFVRIVVFFYCFFISDFFQIYIFASKEWTKLESVESEYLKKLAADLADTLLHSKAESMVQIGKDGKNGHNSS